MPLIIVRENILNIEVDAIVNPTNQSLWTTGGLDKQIQDIEKEYFYDQAKNYTNLELTDVIKFDAHKLKCDYIFNVIGPRYIDGNHNEEVVLRQCYKNILNKSIDDEIETIAIPILSSGFYGFPKDIAIKISKEEIEKFLLNNELTVYVVVYDIESYKASLKYYEKIETYLKKFDTQEKNLFSVRSNAIDDVVSIKVPTFNSTLFKYMDLKKFDDDVIVYKRANVDRKLFSKIRSNFNYRPSKQTALAFCIALKLNLKETGELLQTAGFALSDSLMQDRIVKFFIKEKIYNINEVNETLFSYGEKILK